MSSEKSLHGEKTTSLHNANHESNGHESCAACLWTGVCTCAGLSFYFGHIAYDEWVKTGIKSSKPNLMPLMKPFGWSGIAIGWMAVGIYRYQLG